MDSMSLDDLRDLRNQIDRAISSYETRRRKEAMAALERTAKELGFNLNELTGASSRGRRGAGEGQAKYAHPENPSQTWSGRGRRPRWVTEQIESGKSLEDLRA